jgi:hypothetical protein
MAKNDPVGDNARRGAVRDRSQVFNPTNQTWTDLAPVSCSS